jgi:glycosyltransferase involved in cell wall biosynthesis/regulator of replication initiation timing
MNDLNATLKFVRQLQSCSNLGDTEIQLLAQIEVALLQTETQFQASHQQLQQTQLQLQRLEFERQNLRVEQQHLRQQNEQATQQAVQKVNQIERERERLKVQLQQRIQALESELQFTIAERDQYRGRLSAIESSKFWQIRTQWLLVKNQLTGGKESPFWTPDLLDRATLLLETPAVESPQSEPAEQLAPTSAKNSSKTDYDRWRNHYAPRPADYQRMAETVAIFPYQPLISVIVPVYNTPEPFLRAAIESVIKQIYPNWQLCLADDASTEPHIQTLLKQYAEQDDRIQVTYRPEQGHISQCSNSALELATGEFVALLDHDDLLTPDALYEVALLLNKHPEADLIYSDEDKIDADGHFKEPYFKPDWSPDSFLCRMYTCHLTVYRRALLNRLGGFRVGYEGSQDYDLVLRFTEQTNHIFHIPKILYHWRIHSASTADSAAAKPYAYEAAQRALEEALVRRGEPGQVIAVPNHPGHYIIRYQILEYKRVSVIIPTRDLGEMLDQCLVSIFAQTTYPNYEVIVIDNGSVEPGTQQILEKWQTQQPARFTLSSLDIPFNYSKLNNFAVTKAQGDYLLFLNNDTSVITPDWMTAMVEQVQRPSIGAVGAQLLYPDETIQHAGIVLGIAAATGHSHKHFAANAFGYLGQIVSICNYAAVTGACLMCRKELFQAVGGFEEVLAVGYNDIDLCLKFLAKGLQNVYLPHVKLYHYESKSRGQDITEDKKTRFFAETDWMKQRWSSWMSRDPYYNPNLTTKYQDYRLREPD